MCQQQSIAFALYCKIVRVSSADASVKHALVLEIVNHEILQHHQLVHYLGNKILKLDQLNN